MNATSEYALEMKDIGKSFPGVRALNGVTIQVRKGDVHCLIGENGAGKSTLMKILNGVYPTGTYSGEINLNGLPITMRSPHEAKQRGIGLVPQEISVIDGLSVAENIYVGNWNARGGLRVSFRKLHARAGALLAAIGIDLDPRQQVSSLNASHRQLVMIARSLSWEPSVLILDEPTSALTHEETEKLFHLIRRLQKQRGTIIFITHKLEEVTALADRVTVLRDGAVVAHFERGKFAPGDIIEAMVGRKIDQLFPHREPVSAREEILRVENLTLAHPYFAQKNVIENINFSLHRGEILGLGGLIGSGRSELVNTLYGRHPHTGNIFIGGQRKQIANPRQARRAGIGLVTEDRKKDGLLFNFSIRENITIGNLPAVSRLGILRRREERRRADEFMKQLAIRAPSISTAVGTLSGGNQQKVVLAKMLMAGPKILLLDEPTKGVDVGAKCEIYRLMDELTRAGIGLIFISSELPELLAMCDRFIILAAGRIQDQFLKAEASEHRIMRAATHTA